MKYHQLRNSGLQVSEISFGCMSLSGDESQDIQLLHQALDQGINFFDTADLYEKGVNEEKVGNAFKDRRQKVILATKVGNQWRSDGSGWDWNPTKSYILKAADESLKRLQTDYIDLYQLHGGTLNDPIDETIEAFEILQQQGKIRYYGISSIRPNVIREYVKRSNIVSVMMQYSLLDRRPEEECLDLLHHHNIGVLVRGSVARGLLVDKPAEAYLNYSAEQVQAVAEAVAKVAKSKTKRASVAVRYVLQHPAVASAVVGIRTPAQLESALLVPESPVLSSSQLQKLCDSVPANQYVEHR
ncbi:aldo/keto reductase [Rhodocytophaga rosea]|uniref:Aldo/keto reductase n=1 Tax=Rhodocytophaga rosea TaxID=2704465 RepID=A0A6C0GUM1_9BACT|nr:aldo/keto reductase [Rhodocytophaga rosea]QHT71253.1 aldo/keto reductase [Rhodocytophaga rosea]